MFTEEDKQQGWYKRTYNDWVKTWFQLLFLLVVFSGFVFKFIDVQDTWGVESKHDTVVTVSRDF